MPETLAVPAVALVVFAAALLSPLVVIPWLRARGIMDHPNHRSSHVNPTVRGAGIAPLLSVVLAGILIAVPNGPVIAVQTILVPAVAVALVGMAEDLHGLSVSTRLALQLAMGCGFAVWSMTATGTDIAPGWVLVPLVVVAWVGYVNIANFMDGVDSISALHGVVAGSHFLVAGWVLDEPEVGLVGTVMAAAFLGFAPWNLLARARVFLGDSGSYLLGGLVGCTAIWVALRSGEILLAVAPALPYLVDTGLTMARRVARGQPILEAHRAHTYQQIAASGVPHLVVGSGVAMISAFSSLLAVLQVLGVVPLGLACALIVLVHGGYVLSPRVFAIRPASEVPS